MYVLNVKETFQIAGRGVVVVTVETYETLPCKLKLKIGDKVEFRQLGQIVLQTYVAGLEFINSWAPKLNFAFSLPSIVMKQDVPIGAEI